MLKLWKTCTISEYRCLGFRSTWAEWLNDDLPLSLKNNRNLDGNPYNSLRDAINQYQKGRHGDQTLLKPRTADHASLEHVTDVLANTVMYEIRKRDGRSLAKSLERCVRQTVVEKGREVSGHQSSHADRCMKLVSKWL